MQIMTQQKGDDADVTGGSIVRGIALLACATIALLTIVLGIKASYATLVVLTICVMILLWRFSQQSLGIVLIFSAATLYVVPTISLLYVGVPVNLGLFALFAIVGYAMVYFGSAVERVMPLPDKGVGGGVNFLAVIGLLAGGLIAGAESGGFAQPIFAGAAGVALVHLERLQWARPTMVMRWAALGVYAVAIGLYATFLWDGFGRIVIISFLLLPVLVSIRYRLFQLNPLLLAGVGGLLVFVGRVLRFGISEGIAGISEDSGATHLILSSELLANHPGNTSGTSLFQQFQLFFLNWAPREVWPGKPININSLFVDSYIGRAGLSEEHSTALGFFGEQIYLAGHFWLLTAILAAVMVIAVRALIVRIAQPYYASVVVYDVWVVTLFWGGMASFAARAWFALVPLVLYVLLLRRQDRQQSAS